MTYNAFGCTLNPTVLPYSTLQVWISLLLTYACLLACYGGRISLPSYHMLLCYELFFSPSIGMELCWNISITSSINPFPFVCPLNMSF